LSFFCLTHIACFCRCCCLIAAKLRFFLQITIKTPEKVSNFRYSAL
jgi:hypothetical protein